MDERVERRAGGPRLVLIHYHLFKNAGTSVDAMLRANFGERWAEREFEGPTLRSNAPAVGAWLRARPAVVALSSHTATLPEPVVDGVEVFPILFVRHPVLRLRSAYVFERTQDADTLGARLARAHDFPGYVRALLDTPDHRQARDFQTLRFAFGTPGKGPEIARALRTFERLPFVGLVEAYGRSVQRLGGLLRPRLPGFHPLVVRKNVTSDDARPLGQRVAAVRDELGPKLFDELESANAGDLRLFRRAWDGYRPSAGGSQDPPAC